MMTGGKRARARGRERGGQEVEYKEAPGKGDGREQEGDKGRQEGDKSGTRRTNSMDGGGQGGGESKGNEGTRGGQEIGWGPEEDKRLSKRGRSQGEEREREREREQRCDKGAWPVQRSCLVLCIVSYQVSLFLHSAQYAV
jgi:hypothetical protein